MEAQHIGSIEQTSQLRALIKQDLRELGVKLPKSKKTKKLHKSSSQDGIITAKGTFGNYLSHVPCDFMHNCGYVPKFLIDAAEVIQHNIEIEGIFRKSGAVSRQKELKLHLDEGRHLGADVNVFDVTSLVKQFFRELPEPLLTNVYHDSFVRCFQLEGMQAAQAVLLLCLLLPAEHLSTLQHTMQTLQLVARHAHANKMDEANLAVVMAPNILHLNNRSEKMTGAEERLLQVQAGVVELLIRNAAHIGLVSASLADRCRLMSECFGTNGTEDELDASEDNTLEDSKDVHKAKEKKRKRSGSIHGIMNSIASGFSKLRRSTDGSAKNVPPPPESAVKDGAEGHQYLMALPCATPVVRKRKQAEELAPFSASKRKAILQGLPNQAALGGTPFTPAKTENKRALLDTPGTEQIKLVFGTPATQRSARKKLNIFSPSSSKKNKMRKSPSTGNLPSHVSKKTAKSKNIFRRFSGGRGDKACDQDQGERVGERLASPTKTLFYDSIEDEASITMKNHSLPAGPLHSSSISPTLANATATSTLANTTATSTQAPPTRQGLNEGFILEDTMLEFDETDCSETSRRLQTLEWNGDRGRDVHVGSGARKRSRSADAQFTDGKAPVLRRGQPNTINSGLLEGKPQNVENLRRSFDKSDVSQVLPLVASVFPAHPGTSTSAAETFIKLKPSSTPVEQRPHVLDSHHHHQEAPSARQSSQENLNVTHALANSSLLKVVLPPPQGFADQSKLADQSRLEASKDGYDSDESEAGFSTISGGTVIFRPKGGVGQAATSVSGTSLAHSEAGKREPRGLTPHSSADSLIGSTTSSTSSLGSVAPARPMERSLSTDSGKGSLFDDEMVGAAPDSALGRGSDHSCNKDVTSTSLQTHAGAATQPPPRRVSTDLSLTDVASVVQTLSSSHVAGTEDDSGPQRKSLSANNLYSRPPTGKPASRSQSVNIPSRKHNMHPILPVLGDTQKLLERAGYLGEKLAPPGSRSSHLHPQSPSRQSCREAPSLSAVSERGEQRRKSLSEFHQERQASGEERHAPRRESVSDDRAAGESSRRRSLTFQSPAAADSSRRELETFDHRGKRQRSDQFLHRESGSHDGEPLVHAAERRRDAEPVEESSVPVEPRHTVEAVSIIKRAEAVLPKHESILDLHSKQSGRVASTVKQFVHNNPSSTVPDFSRIPVGTSRQRGRSPVRIPTIFAKGDERANQLKRMAEQLRFKNPQLAEVRLSSDSKHHALEGISEVETLEKLPTYGSNKNSGNDSSVTISSLSSGSCSSRGGISSLDSLSDLTDSQDGVSRPDSLSCQSSSLWEGQAEAPSSQTSELSLSLMETIQEVCTPLTEKYRRRSQQLDRCPLTERTNQEGSGLTTPSTPRPTLTTPLADSVVLRTAQGLTPRRVLRFRGAAKSPGKPVKRLGMQSPRSPLHRSPRRRSPRLLANPPVPAHERPPPSHLSAALNPESSESQV